MGAISARRMIEEGRIHIENSSGVALSTDAILDESSNVDIIVDGHNVRELLNCHYVMYKPVGIQVRDSSEGAAFRSLLEYPRMPFGFVSLMERSVSGLLLLLNDIELGQIITRSRLPRVYQVIVGGSAPVSPAKLHALSSTMPFASFDIQPHPIPRDALPVNAQPGSAYSFTVRTTDSRPGLIRTAFTSLGLKLDKCELESIGPMSLSHFGLTTPGQSVLIKKEQILELL